MVQQRSKRISKNLNAGGQSNPKMKISENRNQPAQTSLDLPQLATEFVWHNLQFDFSPYYPQIKKDLPG